MVALNKLDINNTNDLRSIGKLALELGVKLNDDAPDDAAPAVAYWLFDGSVDTLPGGYDMGELSPNSPVKQLKSFPQDLVSMYVCIELLFTFFHELHRRMLCKLAKISFSLP